MKRFIIGGTGSGCGKTTVTCGILGAMKSMGVRPATFKCGPDYIDPMFHREVTGVPSHNLDSFFCDRDTLLYLLEHYGKGADISVIEGVMGFYDGGEGSAFSLSQVTDTPVILVINCHGMRESLGAVMSGYLNYRKPNNIAGFIFNRLPEKLIPFAQELCCELGTEYYGCLPKSNIVFESRHLGLVTAAETENIREKLKALGELAGKHILTDKLMSGFDRAVPDHAEPVLGKREKPVTIAVSRDSAFCFMYEESLDLLRKLGCETVFFSPLTDKTLPYAQGLILCGGYPELYAEKLSANTSLMAEIRCRYAEGMPIWAECGGFMYLHESITCENGKSYPMCGIIKGNVYRGRGLSRFGYVTLTAESDSLLMEKGGSLKAHEFHYFDSDNCGEQVTAVKPDGRSWKCCHGGDSLFAGFPHVYLWSDTGAAERFVKKCFGYGEKQRYVCTD